VTRPIVGVGTPLGEQQADERRQRAERELDEGDAEQDRRDRLDTGEHGEAAPAYLYA
jgi:hypothetical protein